MIILKNKSQGGFSMDEFKWNSDDFQTNTTYFNGTIEGNATYSDESKMKIRNKFKNKKQSKSFNNYSYCS